MLEDILTHLVATREECQILQDASYSKLTEEKFVEIQEQKCLCLQDLPAVLPVFSCAIHLEKFVFNPAFEKAACGILNKRNSPSYEDFEDFPQDFEEFPEMVNFEEFPEMENFEELPEMEKFEERLEMENFEELPEMENFEKFEDFPEKEDGPVVRDEEPAIKQTGKKLVKGRESRLISKEQRFDGESSKVVGNRGDRRQLWEDTDYSEYDQLMTNLLSGSILDLPMGNPPELLNGFDEMQPWFPDMNELFPDISGYWDDDSYWGRRRMSTDDDNEEVSGETTENDEEGSGKRRALDYFGSNGMCSGWLVVHRSQYYFWKRSILPRFRNCYLQRRSDGNYVLKRRWRRMLTATDENEEDIDSSNGSGTRRGLSAQHWIERACRGTMFAWIEDGVRPTPWQQRFIRRHCYSARKWISDWRRRMSTSENNEENTDSMISTTEDDGQNINSDIEAGSGRRKLWWYDTHVRCEQFGGKEACYRGDWWACGMCGLPLPPWRRRMSTSENNEENTDSMISTTEDDGQNSGNGSGTRRGLSAQQHWRERTCRGMMFAYIEDGIKPSPWMQRYIIDRYCRYNSPSWISDWRRRMSTSENNEENTDSMISTTEDHGQNFDSDIEAGSGRRKLGWWIDRDLQCQRFGGWEACDKGDWWACMMCSYEPAW